MKKQISKDVKKQEKKKITTDEKHRVNWWFRQPGR